MKLLALAALAIPAMAGFFPNCFFESSLIEGDRWTMRQSIRGSLDLKSSTEFLTFTPEQKRNKEWAKSKTVAIPVKQITRATHSTTSWLDPVAGQNYTADFIRIYWTDEQGKEQGALIRLDPPWAKPAAMLLAIQDRIGKPIEEENTKP